MMDKRNLASNRFRLKFSLDGTGLAKPFRWVWVNSECSPEMDPVLTIGFVDGSILR